MCPKLHPTSSTWDPFTPVSGLFVSLHVPGSEKPIEITFALVELSFRGTFAPGDLEKVQMRATKLVITIKNLTYKQASKHLYLPDQ